MRNETTDFVEGERAYVTSGASGITLVKIVSITKRNTRGGVRFTVTTNNGGTYNGAGEPVPKQAWGTTMLRKADAELDRRYMRWRSDVRCRQFARELDRYTDDEVKTVAAAIAVAEDARKQRESST